MKKRALLIVGLALMIATAGVVYAHWQDTLTVDIDVRTGSMNPEWSLTGTNDDGELNAGFDEEPVTNNMFWQGPDRTSLDPSDFGGLAARYDKDVADCFASIATANTLSIDILNGYPSYHCTIKADLHNIGSVPIKVQTSSLAISNPNIEVEFVNAPFLTCGYQLDPGVTVDFEIRIHIANPIPNIAADYTVDLSLGWINWNEYVAGAGGFTQTGPSYPGLYGSTVTPGTYGVAGCIGGGAALDVSKVQNFTIGSPPGGWGGWSCIEPGFTHIASGYVTGGATVIAQGPAKLGSTVGAFTYPTFPHYVYPAGEEGWVANAINQGTLHAICIP